MRFLFFSLLILVILTGTFVLWSLTRRYKNDIYSTSDLNTIDPRPAAIVFGAGYWPSGALSDVLKDRLDAAIELYRAGKVQKLLFSGDNRVEDYNEPAKMREYALSQGIPDTDIVLDFAGRRTYDTCYRARDIFMLQEVVLVTQQYHLPRTLQTCQGLGLDAIGYTADRVPYKNIRWYQFREIFAYLQALLDIYVTHPVPVLGDPLPIFP